MKNLIDIILPSKQEKPEPPKKNWRPVPEASECSCGADRDRLKCKVHRQRIRIKKGK